MLNNFLFYFMLFWKNFDFFYHIGDIHGLFNYAYKCMDENKKCDT